VNFGTKAFSEGPVFQAFELGFACTKYEVQPFLL
jgi:hypothetical protein